MGACDSSSYDFVFKISVIWRYFVHKFQFSEIEGFLLSPTTTPRMIEELVRVDNHGYIETMKVDLEVPCRDDYFIFIAAKEAWILYKQDVE